MSRIATIIAFAIVLLSSCKKKDLIQPEGSLNSPEYEYNVATKAFQPQATITGQLTANINMKVVYYYLQRENKQDTLVQVDFPATDVQKQYDFTVKAESLAGVDLHGVKGLKLLGVQDNDASVEQFIRISYFDPAAPVLTGLPEEISPSLTGTTNITGKVTSETGLSFIYFYDNRSGNFAAIDSIAVKGAKEYSINYNYTYGDGAGQMKIAAVDIYGLKTEQTIQFVNIPFKPVVTFDTDTLRVALPDGKPDVTGTLKTYSAINSVTVYAVTAGGETMEGSITPVLTSSATNEYNYTFTYPAFAYATTTTACKLVVKDAGNSQNAATVPIKILPYYYWKNITMMAQGNSTTNSPSCFFIGDPAQPVIGACDAVNDASYHAKIDFAIFTNSTPYLQINNPANISASTIATFKCNGVSWAPATPTSSTLKKTLLRVLGSGSAETNVSSQFTNNTITALNDAFFAGISAPSANAPNSTQFAAGSLIWGKMTPAGNGITKNILIRVNAVNVVAVPQQGTSTITFDIMKEQ